MKKSFKNSKELSAFVIENLKNLITNPKSELNYKNSFELLIAVILSAQCTDKRVNEVTKELFKKFDTCEKLGYASIEEIEGIIKPCGFYKNKAKHIIEASRKLAEDFGGEVPKDLESLTSLSGVGRKTASVILAVAFEIPAMPVDTHVFRVSKRLGLSKGKNVLEVEKDLKKIIPKEHWIDMHHYLLLFGRYYCKALKPSCENCRFKEICLK